MHPGRQQEYGFEYFGNFGKSLYTMFQAGLPASRAMKNGDELTHDHSRPKYSDINIHAYVHLYTYIHMRRFAYTNTRHVYMYIHIYIVVYTHLPCSQNIRIPWVLSTVWL